MVSNATRNTVIANSMGFCLNPDCRKTLADAERRWFGNIAHICGDSPGSRRHDPTMTEEARNHASNLMALCPDCHELIDKPDGDAEYPVERLRQWAADRLRERARAAVGRMGTIDRAQIRMVVQGLVSGNFQTVSDVASLELTAVDRKLEHNQLSNDIRNIVVKSIARFKEVETCLDHMNLIDPRSSESAARAIIGHYNSSAAFLEGDRLFSDVASWATHGEWTEQARAAAFVVVSYFFERCDIFEKEPTC